MFMIQFVHSHDGTFANTNSVGFPFDQDNVSDIRYAGEVLRFLIRILKLKDKEVVLPVTGMMVYFIPEYRQVVCANIKKFEKPLPWDIERYGKIEPDQLLLMIPIIMNKALDKSLNEAGFMSWFHVEIQKKRPFLRLEAIA